MDQDAQARSPAIVELRRVGTALRSHGRRHGQLSYGSRFADVCVTRVGIRAQYVPSLSHVSAKNVPRVS